MKVIEAFQVTEENQHKLRKYFGNVQGACIRNEKVIELNELGYFINLNLSENIYQIREGDWIVKQEAEGVFGSTYYVIPSKHWKFLTGNKNKIEIKPFC